MHIIMRISINFFSSLILFDQNFSHVSGTLWISTNRNSGENESLYTVLLHRMNTFSEDWALSLFSYKWCLTLFRLQTAQNDDNTVNNWSWSLIEDDTRESEEQFKSESNISWTVSFNVIRVPAKVLQLAAISWRAEVTLLSHSESALWRVITTEQVRPETLWLFPCDTLSLLSGAAINRPLQPLLPPCILSQKHLNSITGSRAKKKKYPSSHIHQWNQGTTESTSVPFLKIYSRSDITGQHGSTRQAISTEDWHRDKTGFIPAWDLLFIGTSLHQAG